MSSLILSPLALVDKEFEKVKENGGAGKKDFIKDFERDSRHMLEKLITSEYDRIPFLTGEKYGQGVICAHQLVRFRGLIRDVLDAEFFLAVYESVDKDTEERRVMTSHYRDYIQQSNHIHMNSNTDTNVIGERFPFIICPIPGETPWSKSFHDGQCTAEDNEVVVRGTSPLKQRKRTQSSQDTKGKTAIQEYVAEEKCTNESGGGIERRTVMRMEQQSAAMDVDYAKGHQRQSTPHFASVSTAPYGTTEADTPTALVKFYSGSSGALSLKLGDVVEVVGIIGPYEGVGTGEEDINGQDDAFHDGTSKLPPSKELPRIHAVTAKKLGGAYPLFSQEDGDAGASLTWHMASPTSPRSGQVVEGGAHGFLTSDSSLLPDVQYVRAAVIKAIASAMKRNFELDLENLDMVAEYVLLSVLSRVHDRQLDGSPLGSLSLNLMGCASSPLMNDLDVILKAFVPRLVRADVTIESLNTGLFQAKKSYDTNLMQPSVLQAAPGTIFLLDETSLNEGTLNNVGVRSLETIRGVANKQSLGIDFEYFDMKVLVDQPVIIASSVASIIGGADVVQVDLGTPKVTAEQQKAVLECLDEETATHARYWWASCRFLSTKVSSEFSKYLEDFFVSMRQADPSVTGADLQAWLKLSHLIAISHGTQNMTIDHFNHAIQLDALRKTGLERRKEGATAQCA